MIASMTGFARREISGNWGALVCELRSVNHRFLESGFRLPDELRAAEGELRQRLARDIKRGKVDCSISRRRVQGAESALEVDSAALERLLASVRDISRTLPGNHTVKKRASEIISARLHGFSAPKVRMFGKYASSSKWEPVEMRTQADGTAYEFAIPGLVDLITFVAQDLAQCFTYCLFVIND